jgi:hypothetical protein
MTKLEELDAAQAATYNAAVAARAAVRTARAGAWAVAHARAAACDAAAVAARDAYEAELMKIQQENSDD